jgi:DNA repair and recombination protein RAD52
LAEIGRALDTPLTGEEIARRVGAGGKKFSYIEGWFVLDQCNRIFGATGWSCEIKDIQVRVRPDKSKGWFAKARVVSRVTLKDGTFHEDISVAGKYNKSESDAEMMACKTAVTDARKRVLRCFGRALGNSVYDKASLLAASRKRPAPQPVSRPAYNREPQQPPQQRQQQQQQQQHQQQQSRIQQQSQQPPRQNLHQQQKKQPQKNQHQHAPQKSPSGPPVDRTNLASSGGSSSSSFSASAVVAPPSVCASFSYSVPQSIVDTTPAETPDPNEALFEDEDDDQLYANMDFDKLQQQAAKRQRISHE